MKKNSIVLVIGLITVSLVTNACGVVQNQNSIDISASGTIAAREVRIAPQIGGEVVSVGVEEGQQVQAGEELFRLDDSLLLAQQQQAQAAVQVAEAGLSAAQTQHDIALNAARTQDGQNPATGWNITQPAEFDLPVWYFNQQEKIASANAEIEASKTNLEKEKTNLEQVLNAVTSQDFLNAEKQVAETQAAFLVADQVLDRARLAQDKEQLEDYAQDLYDAAETNLDSARTNYNLLLSTKAADDVLDARARVTVAQERYDQAMDYYNSLLTGDESTQVTAAEAGIQQAEAALAQAQAALIAIDVQLKHTMATAPVNGVVMARGLEVGETLVPGAVVITIGQLEEVELVVYIPETQYGKVQIGDQVSITVDSFPGETFSGDVIYISDKAEFTPRNVQTVEGRSATVYAVKLSVPNPDLKLKPGMPADVTFVTP